MSQLELLLYSRQACGLCEEMHQSLHERYGDRLRIRVVDIEGDSALEARYGNQIPVLVHEGETLCFGRLNPDRVDALLASS